PLTGLCAVTLSSLSPSNSTCRPRSSNERYLSGCGQSMSRATTASSTKSRAARTWGSEVVLSMTP
ncbi:hypothetical protein LTR16_012209, partial [Cryomyces antarcticus]